MLDRKAAQLCANSRVVRVLSESAAWGGRCYILSDTRWSTVGSRVVVQSLEISWHFYLIRISIEKWFPWQDGVFNIFSGSKFEISIWGNHYHNAKSVNPEKNCMRPTASHISKCNKNEFLPLLKTMKYYGKVKEIKGFPKESRPELEMRANET